MVMRKTTHLESEVELRVHLAEVELWALLCAVVPQTRTEALVPSMFFEFLKAPTTLGDGD